MSPHTVPLVDPVEISKQLFESMTREERHRVHRALLDVMRLEDDSQLVNNADVIHARLTPGEKWRLQEHALDHDTTVSALVRQWVRAGMRLDGLN